MNIFLFLKRIFRKKIRQTKEEWKLKNNLNRKIDACNLYLTDTAYSCTYEEYKEYMETRILPYFPN